MPIPTAMPHQPPRRLTRLLSCTCWAAALSLSISNLMRSGAKTASSSGPLGGGNYATSAASASTTTADNTDPDPSLPTLALTEPYLKGGFRNQAMRFNALVMEAVDRNVSQILLPSMRWGDTHGTKRAIPFDRLFDVRHWNSYHPRLPRMVNYDPLQHHQWDDSGRLLNVTINNPLLPGSPTQFLKSDGSGELEPNDSQASFAELANGAERNRTHPMGGGG